MCGRSRSISRDATSATVRGAAEPNPEQATHARQSPGRPNFSAWLANQEC
jgi:hypothetical protein